MIQIITITIIIDQVVQTDTVLIGTPNKVYIMLQVLGVAHTVRKVPAVVEAVGNTRRRRNSRLI
jgi:hypothetical protein